MFLEVTKGYDVVILVEWGRGQELTDLFTGYKAYFNHLSVTSSRSRRGGGKGEGICVLVRETIYSTLLKHTRHATWVQLGQGQGRIVIGGAYMHPDTSNAWAKAAGGTMSAADAKEVAFARLRDDLIDYKSVGPVLLFGDFNARVGTLADVDTTVESILDSMSFNGDEAASQHVPSDRQNQDTGAADSFGKMLVGQCCIEAGCVLLNGRARGDEQGHVPGSHIALIMGLLLWRGIQLFTLSRCYLPNLSRTTSRLSVSLIRRSFRSRCNQWGLLNPLWRYPSGIQANVLSMFVSSHLGHQGVPCMR